MKSDKDFTRNYKLTASAIVTKILHSFSDPLSHDINVFLPELINSTITEGAFSIARYKISHEYFHYLLRFVTKQALKSFIPKRWNNYRVLATDGTTISVPTSADTINHFGIKATSDSGKKTILANALILYDILSDIIIDGEIAPYKTSEQTLINKVLDNNKIQNSILLADRNFGCFYFYKKLIKSKIKFCFRQKASKLKFTEKIMADERDDFITDWYPSEKERQSSRLHGLDTEPIRVRVTKILLNTGEIELLISNLFESSISLKSLKELYKMRWEIEGVIKQIKPIQKMEQFGCKKTQGVYQEFFSHLIMKNLTSMFASLKQEEIEDKTKNRRYRYTYNKTNAWKYLKLYLIKFVTKTKIDIEIELLAQTIASNTIPIKPDRSEPRDSRKNAKKRRNQNYK